MKSNGKGHHMKRIILTTLLLSSAHTSLFAGGWIVSKEHKAVENQITDKDKIVNEIKLPDGTTKFKVKMGRGYTTEFIVIENGKIVDRKTY